MNAKSLSSFGATTALCIVVNAAAMAQTSALQGGAGAAAMLDGGSSTQARGQGNGRCDH
jgi:hypothetical protein